MNIFKLVIVILSIILAVGYAIAFYNSAKDADINQPADRYFMIGFLGYIPLWFIIFRKKYFFSTFEHELTHLLVGLIFFKKPAFFTATDGEGGVTGMYGNNFIITLAPYFLPTFTYLLLPLYLVIDHRFYQYYFLVLGLITSYHVFSTWQEFGFHQTDITKSGKVFSCIFLAFANIFVYGILISFVIGGFKNSWHFMKNGVFFSYDGILSGFSFIKNLIL
jgi:hypothetical protein